MHVKTIELGLSHSSRKRIVGPNEYVIFMSSSELHWRLETNATYVNPINYAASISK